MTARPQLPPDAPFDTVRRGVQDDGKVRAQRRGFAALGLVQPKNSINVGHVLRAAGVFGAALVAVTGNRMKGSYPTDTEAVRRHTPLLYVPDLRQVIPHDCVPIAIELVEGAKPLPAFPHPPRGFYVFGPEDGSLGESVLSWCRDVIRIPAGCLNLAACVNVVLYDRIVKRGEWELPPSTALNAEPVNPGDHL